MGVRHPWHIGGRPHPTLEIDMLDILSGVVIGLHLVSVHIPQRAGQHNFNPGIYARDTATGITVGTYHNTLGKQTFYVGETWQGDWFGVTVGVASGYQRKQYDVACDAAQAQAGLTHCWYATPGVKAYLTPMVAPSVRLPTVLGLTPRLTFMPGFAGSSNVFHLSVEHAF